ncbi:MAG: hypothetical protein V4723_16620 [Pseudomonadota bacterium]
MLNYKTIYLRGLLFVAGLATYGAAQAADNSQFWQKSPSVLYFGEKIPVQDENNFRRRLKLIADSGVNAVVAGGGVGDAAARDFFDDFASDPSLKRFKVIYRLNQALSDYHAKKCQGQSTDCAAPPWLFELVQFLSRQDRVVGYYVFDEPATYHAERGGRIAPDFQLKVYKVIRQADPDRVSRPVINTNHAYQRGQDENVVLRHLSPSFQDMVFLQRYSTDVQKFKKDNELWRKSKVLSSVPHVPIYPVFVKNKNHCSAVRDTLFFSKSRTWNLASFADSYRSSMIDYPDFKRVGVGFYSFRSKEGYSWWKHLDASACDDFAYAVAKFMDDSQQKR